LISGLIALLATAGAWAADSGAGRAVFRDRCALCHSAEPGDNGGGQGPSLAHVYGHLAASSPAFSYTAALRTSGLTWDAATLERFLADPSTVVPGSAMVLAVPDATERANLVAYLQSVDSIATPVAAAAPFPKPAGLGDWRRDRPGRVHRIVLASLPAPFASPAVNNHPQVVPRPAHATLRVPAGFHVAEFATQLVSPRKMLVETNGDILVTEYASGRVSIMHPSADGTHAASVEVYAAGLRQPFGLTFYPDAEHPEWLYVGETHRVIRYAFRTGDVKPRGAPEVVVAELPSGRGHATRDIAFSQDGKRMFVSVGSGSNVAEEISKKPLAEAQAFDAEHGFGAAWDQETNRADVLVFDAAAPGAPRVYATGIRNCVSLTIQPVNGALWCTTNERDNIGDDLVPDYSTRVTEHGFYGWPWYYMGSNEDPRLKGDRPDLSGKVLVPDVPYQAHSAALNLMFYTASSGRSAFPAEYVGEGFAAFHGSWNRAFRTGHKVVRLRMKNGEPTGEYDDFLTGFIIDDASVWGRPVALAELADGSVLLSEDGGNRVFRISYGH
jgi:glucose/arabinose dehydrogenase/cytochrome c2